MAMVKLLGNGTTMSNNASFENYHNLMGSFPPDFQLWLSTNQIYHSENDEKCIPIQQHH